ncbi:MAG: hypothetical protein A3D74_04955 [Candidatus Levybacteria bacterium RIFCSPHIGHO2_02_FULL_37_13]|nr:MAG: hypothetical protein A3D74_04955 [Candidatus Levybacteria bacterium RIFCSPHIGHO2_02_FULL_37_13]OGH30425.1 MAG: hypothetical protein A3E40_05275 [Candidatus Levybacteria bacterium RIFCSPHIGHO2_12_FULL_37_9]OGH40147.1 MAG: hypothetical protein A3B41_04830 [Candidatus Levybacteria bacterium RIFCSPLOWO2_01_FULL_37_26]
MHFVYILKSKITKKLYIGCTSDLKTRFLEHNSRTEKSTKNGVPWILVYYEAFLAKSDATKREKQIKSFKSAYGFLKRRIKNSIALE